MAKDSRRSIISGTMDVFANLGCPEAAELRPECAWFMPLKQVPKEPKLSQADAAKVMWVTQPNVSLPRDYKFAGFTIERLMNRLTALEQDVEILNRQKPRHRNGARITIAV